LCNLCIFKGIVRYRQIKYKKIAFWGYFTEIRVV
jgi:hypothetical protein